MNLVSFGRRQLRRSRFYYKESRWSMIGRSLSDRWTDIESAADFRPTDEVLDMGCAEGLISLQVARQVAHVDGFEVMPARVQRAQIEAVRRGIANVSFAIGSVTDYPLEPMSYDVVLLLGVLNKKTNTGYVGVTELERLLRATKRQILIRANVQSPEKYNKNVSLAEIFDVMHEHGFDGLCFPRRGREGNLIVGSRRGTDAKLVKVPPLVLLPTEHLREHPCLKGASIGPARDFA